MEYKNIGNTGLKISVISLGSWMTFGQRVDDETTEACMTAAYEGGVNFFDGAEAYGNGAAELAMGRVLKVKGWSRDTLILSGKVNPNAGSGPMPSQKGLSRKHVRDCCEQTLRRLGVDYLDLYLCHRPDPDTPLLETLRAMNELIQQGKILYWGTSEFSTGHLMELWRLADRHGLIGPTVEQCSYNMVGREKIDVKLAPVIDQYGIGTTVYSPLAGGILSGKYNDGVPESTRFDTDVEWLRRQLNEGMIAKSRKLAGLAGELDCSQAQLALAWIIKNRRVSTCLTGATRPEQVRDNLQAVDVVPRLSEEVLARIEEILAD